MAHPNWLFNIHDQSQGIQRTLAQGLTSRIFAAGEQVMISVVRVEPYSQGKLHSHPEEQWGVLLEGECIRVQGDEEVRVKAGDFWISPSNVPHTLRTEAVGALILDIFSPPRAEYKQAGEGFGNAKSE